LFWFPPGASPVLGVFFFFSKINNFYLLKVVQHPETGKN